MTSARSRLGVAHRPAAIVLGASAIVFLAAASAIAAPVRLSMRPAPAHGGFVDDMDCSACHTSITSSNVLSPVRGAFTSTAMLPGACWFFHILVCATGISVQGNTSDRQGSMRRSMTNLLAADACLRLAK